MRDRDGAPIAYEPVRPIRSPGRPRPRPDRGSVRDQIIAGVIGILAGSAIGYLLVTVTYNVVAR